MFFKKKTYEVLNFVSFTYAKRKAPTKHYLSISDFPDFRTFRTNTATN